MSSGARVPYGVAYAAALSLVDALGGSVVGIALAGSLRRGKPDVGDIELVCVPRLDTVEDGFFASSHVNMLSGRIASLIEDGFLASHPTDPKRGERYSKVVHVESGMQVDIFSTAPESFGSALLIRTGPAEYSHRFVVDLRRVGLHVADGYQLHRGGLGCGAYECEVIPTPEEADVYQAAGWPFVTPEDRA